MVNQALGRALRHINDYAYIMLVDFRFQGNLLQKLPKWVKFSLQDQKTAVTDSQALEKDLNMFFENR
jgi:Rad3-related DNA helicase